MGIAGGLVLIIIGAILAFAVNVHIWSINLQAIGWIILLAGLFSLGFTMWRTSRTKRRVVDVRRDPHSTVEQEVEHEHIERREPPPPAL